MQNLDINTISDYITEAFASGQDERSTQLMRGLIAHLHDYVREVKLTHDEWFMVLKFLQEAGDITTDSRNEFMLLSDVTGVTSLVDILSEEGRPEATPASPLGPFYLADAPFVEQGGLLCEEADPGIPTILKGKVTENDGTVIKGALLDIWHNADSGKYSNVDETQNDMNNRGRIYTNENGEFSVRTIRPQAYTVPIDGPVGDLMRAFDRSPWRSAHIHIIVSADGYEPVTTELFLSDCEYIDSDAVAGVRASLVHDPVYEDTELGNTLILDHHFQLRKEGG